MVTHNILYPITADVIYYNNAVFVDDLPINRVMAVVDRSGSIR